MGDAHAYAIKTASARKAERIKFAREVVGWAGANERTVKNWILGKVQNPLCQ
jgi:hypothetical protein